MKKSLSILIVIILIIAQACIVEDKYKESDIYSDFETEKGFSVFHLPPVLFKIVLSVSDEKEIA